MTVYAIYVLPNALQEIKNLPGHVRQRVKRTIDAFTKNPRPPGSIELSAVVIPKPNVTLHRFKIDKWRIVYAIDEDEKMLDVLTVRQRPPYDYDDLDELIQTILP